MELTKSANPSRTEASSSTIEIIDALGIWFLYVQSTLEPESFRRYCARVDFDTDREAANYSFRH
jgi:hypothetical protein